MTNTQNTTEKKIPFISMALSSKKEELQPSFNNYKAIAFTRYEEAEVYGKKMYKAFYEDKYCFFMSNKTKFTESEKTVYTYIAQVHVNAEGVAEYSYTVE